MSMFVAPYRLAGRRFVEAFGADPDFKARMDTWRGRHGNGTRMGDQGRSRVIIVI